MRNFVISLAAVAALSTFALPAAAQQQQTAAAAAQSQTADDAGAPARAPRGARLRPRRLHERRAQRLARHPPGLPHRARMAGARRARRRLTAAHRPL